MEKKKNESKTLESKKLHNFLLGLVAAMSLTLVAFEWKKDVVVEKKPHDYPIESKWEEETPPIYRAKPKELPQPKVSPDLPPAPSPEPVPDPFPQPDPDPSPTQDPVGPIDVGDLFGDEVLVDDPIPAPTRFPSEMPEFPGGDKEMYAFLSKHMKYPAFERSNNVEGKVYVQFVIDENGKIKDVEIVRGVMGGEGLNKEAMRVIQSMPNWTPGYQGDKKVPVIHVLAINFTLN